MLEKNLSALKVRLQEIDDLQNAAAVLGWDQATYMPPGGAEARGRQMATLGRIAQEKFIDVETGRLIDACESQIDSLPYDNDDASLIRVARRSYDQSVKISPEFLAEFTVHSARSYQAWTQARPNNDYAAVKPLLQKSIEYSRQLAEFFPGYTHVADPLINFSDYGMTTAQIRSIFAELRGQLTPLVKEISEQPQIDNDVLFQQYDVAKQRAFGEKIIKQFGYDFNRGRQDTTHHPFMTKFSLGDVRITTRFNENDVGDGLFSTLHEAGHAMYEQGIAMNLDGSLLAGGTSAGIHESQSRLWENIVGRSYGFWEHYFGELQATFPQQLGNTSADAFYRAINRVSPSLIRVDADEVTYNLHVMLRFDLAIDLLEGTLSVDELPDAWHARYQADFGLRAPDDTDGVLQDVHWYAGTIGGSFQGYTLGNIMSGLFYAQALKEHPSIPDEIRQGEFKTLHSWMTENIYRHGSKFTANELIERTTGSGLSIEPYMAYLRGKFGQLYNL